MQATEQYLTAWAAAEPAGGTGAQETRLASGCTAAGPLGFTLPKQAWLARHRSGDRIYQDCSSEEVRGRAISQDTKAVTAHQRPRQRPGPPDPEATRATLVLASNAGRRPLAAIHMSFIAGTRGRPAISGPGGSLAALAALSSPRKIFIHVNNTNPILREDSAERAAIVAAGWEVAHDGQELRL